MSIHPDACSVLLDPASTSLMTSSASASAFLADEEASICPLLLSATPSPPPLDYVDPPSRVQAEEEASTCPLLLSATPSPPPLDYVDPPTGDANNVCAEQGVEQGCCVEAAEEEEGGGNEETSSSDGTEPAGALFGGMGEYQHLGKSGFVHQGVQDVCTGKVHLPDNTSEPCFVSWNWPVIRTCSFWFCTLAVAACCAAVAYALATMPTKCNPKTPWYRGGVFYEAPPLLFSDSDGDGIGDLRGLASRSDYLSILGISALRLNSIFPSLHKGEMFVPVTSLVELDEALGTPDDFSYLVKSLHARNISLILDLPIYPYVNKLEPVQKYIKNSADTENVSTSDVKNDLNNTGDNIGEISQYSEEDDDITKALKLWINRGADGFYLLGLENLADDNNLLDSLASWKNLIGQDKILIVNRDLLDNLEDDGEVENVLASTDLVDVRLSAWNDSLDLGLQIERALSGPLSPERGAWIHWSMGPRNFILDAEESYITTSSLPRNATLAATLMQMMLPGTTSIYHGDEIALQQDQDLMQQQMTLRPVDQYSTEQIAAMIRLRLTTPVIYRNAVRKQGVVTSNFAVRHSANDLLVLERWYPRRNSFASITNMSPASVTLDMSGMFYSGIRMLYSHQETPDSQTSEDYEKIFFKSLHLHPHETLVVKLDK